MAFLLVQLAGAPIVSETVETGDRERIDLARFECRDISRSTVLQRVCYDHAQRDLVVATGGFYARYCGVAAETVDRLLGAPSMGKFFNRHIRRDAAGSRYDCSA
nr:KTSC domain-containing protein [Bradyrhizobium sp. 199]